MTTPAQIVSDLLNQSRAGNTPDTADPFWPNLCGPMQGKPEQAEISTPAQCRESRKRLKGESK